jgi:hypothetical protein
MLLDKNFLTIVRQSEAGIIFYTAFPKVRAAVPQGAANLLLDTELILIQEGHIQLQTYNFMENGLNRYY